MPNFPRTRALMLWELSCVTRFRRVTSQTKPRAILARILMLPIVAVSVNQSLESLEQIAVQLQPRALQLHGDESPALVLRTGGPWLHGLESDCGR